MLAIGQLDDPAMWGVLLRSAALALAAYALLLGGAVWTIDVLLAGVHWPRWIAAVVATLGVALAAFWLFLPSVMLIATLYIERIARAVDARHYPFLPPPSPAALPAQLWDGAVLAVQVLLLNGLALLVALLPFPGVAQALAIAISGWAIGRGLFVAVAMRRMDRQAAHELYRRHRLAVLLPGALLAVAASVPGINLLVPLVGSAAMVHVLNRMA